MLQEVQKNNFSTKSLKLKLLNLICSLIIDYILTNGSTKCTYILKLKESLFINKVLLLHYSFEKI